MKVIVGEKSGLIPAFRSRWAQLSCEGHSPFAQIDQSQHRESAIGVLGQATIAYFGEAPDALECQERMLNLGAHTGLPAVGLSVRCSQGATPVCSLVGEVLGSGRDILELLALLLAPVGI